MLIEVFVLRGDERVDNALRDRSDGNVDTALARILGDEPAVIGMDARHDRRFVLGEHLVIRQLLRDLPKHKRNRARYGNEQDHARREHEAQKAQEEPAALLLPPLPGRFDWCCDVHGVSTVPPPHSALRGTQTNPNQEYGNKAHKSPEIEDLGPLQSSRRSQNGMRAIRVLK